MMHRRLWLLAFALSACQKKAPADDAPKELVNSSTTADPVVARIGKETITHSAVSAPIAMELYRLDVDRHTLLKRQVDLQLEKRLLEAEATARKTSVDALVEEAHRRAPPVSEEQVDAYVDEHNTPSEHRARVKLYLEEKGRLQSKLDFIEALRQKAGVEVLLQPPERPRVKIDVEGALARGPMDAAVTAVHFGSLSNARSVAIAETLRKFGQERPLRQVYRPALRPGDEAGLRATLALRLSPTPWALFDALVARGGRLGVVDVQEVAKQFGVTPGALEAAALDPDRLRSLKRELDVAKQSGVHTPPVVFVNGIWFQGSFELKRLRKLLEDEAHNSRL